jgi:hypothetical protein
MWSRKLLTPRLRLLTVTLLLTLQALALLSCQSSPSVEVATPEVTAPITPEPPAFAPTAHSDGTLTVTLAQAKQVYTYIAKVSAALATIYQTLGKGVGFTATSIRAELAYNQAVLKALGTAFGTKKEQHGN